MGTQARMGHRTIIEAARLDAEELSSDAYVFYLDSMTYIDWDISGYGPCGHTACFMLSDDRERYLDNLNL